MKLYFAPLEGITGYIYRNAYRDFFGMGVEEFFTPFIGVSQNGFSKSGVREDFYEGHPNLESFAMAYNISKAPVCYNGDIFTVSNYQAITQRFPHIERIMLGRGPLINPGLIPEILTGEKVTVRQIQMFHDRLYHDYGEIMSGEKNTLFKMKELWNYMQFSFKDSEKYIKKIRKAQKAVEYERAVNALFYSCELTEEAGD